MAQDRSDERSERPAPGETPYRWFFAADRRPGGEAPMASLATAREDAALAAQLLGMPRTERLQLARRDARFHRVTLVALLNVRAEIALLRQEGGNAGERDAELATVVAAALERDRGGRVWKAGALAYWLFGKARLHGGDVEGARIAFSEMFGFIVDNNPTEEMALAAAGWAQVDQQAGCREEAVAHFQRAAYLFAQIEGRAPAGACLAEVGFLLLDTGDWMLARRNLQRAWHLLDPALAPSMAARVALACAECEILLAEGPGAGWLERARGLYALPASPCEELTRAWTEGRIAALAGRHAEAELLLDGVRQRLLAQGSLREAVTVSCDQLLARLETRQRRAAATLIQGLRTAFPLAGEAWAAALQTVSDLAAQQGVPTACRAAGDFLDRLRAAPAVAPGRPDLLPSLRALTDRLLRHCGELEEPLGAARGL
jgi:tetratricopeptide (TPR) repeat protein